MVAPEFCQYVSETPLLLPLVIDGDIKLIVLGEQIGLGSVIDKIGVLLIITVTGSIVLQPLPEVS